MSPKEFERQIGKLMSVLEGQDAKVHWDAKIPDPDNPSQERQVDVLIERDGLRTLVECRHRRNPQNVMWIEELLGRKVSLRANTVIAVSSSGFTRGACKKAQALGVILREFGSLTPTEIAAWGKGTQVFLLYLRLGRVDLNMVTPFSMVRPVTRAARLIKKGNGEPWPVESLFNNMAEQLRDVDTPKGVARAQMFTKDCHVGGIKVDEILLQGEFERLRIPLFLPVVHVYGSPDEDSLRKMVSIEKVADTDFEIFRAPGEAFVVLDLSVAEPIKNAFFQAVVLHNRDQIPVRGFGSVGKIRPHWDLRRYRVRLITRGSAEYTSLIRFDEEPLIIQPSLELC